MRLVRLPVTLLVAFAASAAPASAQDGPVVDPDSPTGKEYALPLDSARKQASGKNDSASGGNEATPLFGEGIESAGEDATANSERKRKRSPSRSDGKGAPSVAASDPQEAARIIATARPGAPGDGGLSPFVAAGGGLLLVGIGASAGLALRRRSRSER
jgi:opacity protein-like surface antigen